MGLNDVIEWGFDVPPCQVDLERVYSEAISVPTIIAQAYFEEFRLNASVTYARFKEWVGNNNKNMGCLKLL